MFMLNQNNFKRNDILTIKQIFFSLKDKNDFDTEFDISKGK